MANDKTQTVQMLKHDLDYLELLSESFPTATEVATEIINLEAILNLPKGTEHFLADIPLSMCSRMHPVVFGER